MIAIYQTCQSRQNNAMKHEYHRGFGMHPRLLTMILLCFSASLRGETKPNVVIILADDLGYGDLGCYGSENAKTPNIDQMAREGMRFTGFYAAASVCSASRAGLLTGRYPIRTGVTGVISANTKNHLPLKEVTLAERFKALGYATAIFGKWHLGNTPDVWPLKQGFDEWFGTIGSNDMGKGRPSLEARRSGKAGVELVEQDKVIEINPDQRLLTRRYTDRAVEFILRIKAKPFFLFVPHNMPHTPLFVSNRFEGKSNGGLYGDVVMEIDDSVGRILGAIKSAGIDEQTIVLFTSDNGPWLIFGDHGGSASPLSGGKKQTLEGGMRVPMVLRGPGRVAENRVSDTPVTALDLTPTLLASAGVKSPPEKVDGRDMSNLLLGHDIGKAKSSPFFYFWERELRGVRVGRWKLQRSHVDKQAPDPARIGNDGERGKVTKIRRAQALYNLQTDPGEERNLASQHPEKVRELMARMAAFEEELNETAQPAGRIKKTSAN
jgi:arylsulfatase